VSFRFADSSTSGTVARFPLRSLKANCCGATAVVTGAGAGGVVGAAVMFNEAATKPERIAVRTVIFFKGGYYQGNPYTRKRFFCRKSKSIFRVKTAARWLRSGGSQAVRRVFEEHL